MPRAQKKEADPLGHAWCCAYTHHGEETRAAGSLENDKGYPTYMPRICRERVSRGKVVRDWEPLFDRYVFVLLPLRGLWQPARYARGVAKLISSPSGTPLAVPLAAFEEIRKRCGGDRAEIIVGLEPDFKEKTQQRRFEKGDAVRVIDGPWAGWNGFVELSKRKRVEVLLSIFGRETITQLTPKQVELVA